MVLYKNKECLSCNDSYTPTSPKQKYCLLCRGGMILINQQIRDKKRNRLKHNKLYKNKCPSCSNIFDTYDSKKMYCGSIICDRYRRKVNSILIEKNRLILRKKLRRINRAKLNAGKLKQIITYLGKYNYTIISAHKYKSSHKSLLYLRCPNNHIWETTFHNFKDCNNRCAICYNQNNYVSKPEQTIRDFIANDLPDIKVEYNNRSILSPQELDLYFPDHNLAIEICGLYWHGELSSGKAKEYHYNKMIKCYDKGVRLITIFEDEINNTFDIVKSRISQALGKSKRRIFARKCEVRVIDSKTTNIFYRNNHIQGASVALERWGLYYNDELVCVGSLGKIGRKHTSNTDTIELKRFCTLPNVSIVGGVGKIFKRMKEYAVSKGYTLIKSYCDMRYGNIFKPVYEVLGFELEGFTKYTPHYFKNQKRYRNFSLRKTPEERLTGKTEWELRQEQGYDRIWDCGHRTYIYKL